MYTPSPVPEDTPEGLKAWLARELQNIARELSSRRVVLIAPSGTAPARPRDGMIAYADGAAWDPGSGPGFYGYESGSWTKL